MQEYCLTCHGVEIEWRVEELIMSLRDTRNKTFTRLVKTTDNCTINRGR